VISKYKKWFGSPSSKESGIQGEEDNILLIEGTFNPVEAADVLLSLVSYKIKFHNLQLLNIDQITEESREQSEKRIAELKEAKSKITQLIMDARNSGASLEINSQINIKIHPSK